MKYLKMLALAAVAAGALMAFIGAGTASATVLCSANETPCSAANKWPVNTTLDFSVAAGGSLSLVNTEGESVDTCKEGTVEGVITNAGSSTSTVTGELTKKEETIAKTGLTWGNCSFPTKTLSTSGKLEVHSAAAGNGVVTSDSPFEVTINTVIFGSCIYGVEANTSIGEITEGKPGIFHANATAIKFSGSNVACPSTSKWTGTYTQTLPSNTTLYVSAS